MYIIMSNLLGKWYNILTWWIYIWTFLFLFDILPNPFFIFFILLIFDIFYYYPLHIYLFHKFKYKSTIILKILLIFIVHTLSGLFLPISIDLNSVIYFIIILCIYLFMIIITNTNTIYFNSEKYLYNINYTTFLNIRFGNIYTIILFLLIIIINTYKLYELKNENNIYNYIINKLNM